MKAVKILTCTLLCSALSYASGCSCKDSPAGSEIKPVSEKPFKITIAPIKKIQRSKPFHLTATITNTSDENIDYVDWSCSCTANWPTNTSFISAELKYCHRNTRSFGGLEAGGSRSKQLTYQLLANVPDSLIFQVGYRSGNP
ncbi:MAG: hypothetical protein JRJ87_26295, partial [Deltaproteobacteria bacterium]|nr:hypothetical protein [Deltaproteobacteria bacterium]